MIRKNHFLIFLATMFFNYPVFSQGERKDKTAVTYEEIYDEPSSINKLFVKFMPLYGEVFVTNINAGFGIEASYYHNDKLDFHAQFRKTYSQKFFDLSRDLAIKNGDVDNRSQAFNYFEVGGTYHLKDAEESSKTKMFLFKNSYKGNKWAARVPLSAEIPCKVRKITGIRLGAINWKGTTDLNRAMQKQGLTNEDLKSTSDETVLPNTHRESGRANLQPVDVFTNIYSTAVFVGGSITRIRNVAVNFDKFEEGIDDLIFTAYADILVAPYVNIDNIVYTTDKGDPINATTRTYSVSPIKTRMLGFRAGIEGKFNRTWGWAYGGEVGYRPSLQGRSFYALIKISFPVFGTSLDYKVESFGK